MNRRSIFGLCLLGAILALPVPLPSVAPWNKPPQKWTLSDIYKILRESPWSPAKVQTEVMYTRQYKDPLTGILSDAPVQLNKTWAVTGVEISRNMPLPSVSVLWWSSKTIRLAEARLAQLRSVSPSAVALRVQPIPDYVLEIEGQEPVRILRDAAGDLHDTVFLELDNGMTLDFTSVTFIKATDTEEARAEFHFPRLKDGQPTIDIHAARVIFHCRASAKTPLEGRDNTIALRVEFRPKDMRVRNIPDL